MKPSLIVAGVAASVLLLAGCGSGGEEASQETSAAAPSEQVLIDKAMTDVLNQQLKYPNKGAAEISSAIVVLQPAQETGFVKNKVPTYIYVLEGTLSVEYKDGTIKDFGAGTAFLDAVGSKRNARNQGDNPVRLLTVTMNSSR